MTNNPPEPIGLDSESEYVANLNIADTVELDTETEDLIAQRMEVQQQIKNLEQKLILYQKQQKKNKNLSKIRLNKTLRNSKHSEDDNSNYKTY